jgi:hypothetical protein
MKYGIPDEYITDDFIKIVQEIEELYGKITWTEGEYDMGFLPHAWSLDIYLEEGLIKNTEQNVKIAVIIYPML